MLWDVTTLRHHLQLLLGVSMILYSTLFQLLECLDFVVHYKYSRVTFISVPDQRKQSHPSCCCARKSTEATRNWRDEDHTWGLTTPHWIINLTSPDLWNNKETPATVHNKKKLWCMYYLSHGNMFQVAKKRAFRLIYGAADVDQSREMGTVAAPTFTNLTTLSRKAINLQNSGCERYLASQRR